MAASTDHCQGYKKYKWTAVLTRNSSGVFKGHVKLILLVPARPDFFKSNICRSFNCRDHIAENCIPGRNLWISDLLWLNSEYHEVSVKINE